MYKLAVREETHSDLIICYFLIANRKNTNVCSHGFPVGFKERHLHENQ